jgi:hypothetical protein
LFHIFCNSHSLFFKFSGEYLCLFEQENWILWRKYPMPSVWNVVHGRQSCLWCDHGWHKSKRTVISRWTNEISTLKRFLRAIELNWIYSHSTKSKNRHHHRIWIKSSRVEYKFKFYKIWRLFLLSPVLSINHVFELYFMPEIVLSDA